jgi:hypothetical protein
MSDAKDVDRRQVANNGALTPTTLPLPDQGTGFQPPSKVDLHSEARTAKIIALSLVTVLVASVLAQYIALTILTIYNRNDAVPNFEHLFSACFPVLAGLVGSAVTYYLTKDKK